MSRRQANAEPVPIWFLPTMVVIAGMTLLLLGDIKTHLADPITFRLVGAAVMGMGVYWGLTNFQSRRKKRS